MKNLLLVICLLPFISAAQPGWKGILNNTISYYTNTSAGSVEYSFANKTVLRDDTANSHASFIFYKTDHRFGKLKNNNSQKYSLYKNERSYFLDPEKATYYTTDSKDNHSDDHLKFLPHWNPAVFFKPFLNNGNRYGVKILTGPLERQVILQFNNGSNYDGSLVIDTSTNEIKTVYEKYTDRRLGIQLKIWSFAPVAPFNFPDSLASNLTFCLANYSDKQIGMNEEPTIEELTGRSINSHELQSLLASLNYQSTGAYILFDFFYQSCMPCIKAIPELNQLRAEIELSKLLIVGIDPVPTDSGYQEKFIKRYNISYPIIDGYKATEIKKLLLPGLNFAYPTLVLLSPEGKVIKIAEGYKRKHYKDIKELISR